MLWRSRTRGLQALDTELCADTVEWCPVPGWHHILACGTYQLQERRPAAVEEEEEESTAVATPPRRIGRLYLFEFRQEEGGGSLTPPRLSELQRVDTPAVLDLKWCHVPVSGRPLLAMATADGDVRLYALHAERRSQEEERRHPHHHRGGLEALGGLALGGGGEGVGDRLALSLDWSTGRGEEDDVRLVCSDSAGWVNVLSLSGGEGVLTSVSRWKAHDAEAWVSAFSYWDPRLVYSGADDRTLKGWDLRTAGRPTFTSRAHTAGVCSVHSNPHREHVLATGGYDEHVLLWDGRDTRRPLGETAAPLGGGRDTRRPLGETPAPLGGGVLLWDGRDTRRPLGQTAAPLGGGVWRLKWHPTHGSLLLAACTHGGVHVLHCGGGGEEDGASSVVASYGEHDSLAYGADWARVALEEEDEEEEEEEEEEVTAARLGSSSSVEELWETSETRRGSRIRHESLLLLPATKDGEGRHNTPKTVVTSGMDGSPSSLSCLLATCSFYDHALHVWRWDWGPEKAPPPPPQAPPPPHGALEEGGESEDRVGSVDFVD